MNNKDIVIKVEHVSKSFKVYFDKSNTLKEKVLFWKRNRFEVRNVLNDVSFEIHKGDSVGLIGRNGCGKSTMLKMLTRIYYPNSGKITINGKVSSLIELGAGFHPDMSGRENIYINASTYGLSKDEIDKRLDKIIEFSELREFIDNPIRTYSSGMYMRLAFAVAINVDAEILLIDEILAVGDANFQTKCFNKLKELQAQGITIVLVTHSMDSIKKFCNKCIWLEKGSVIGKMDETNKVTKQYIEYMTKEAIEKGISSDNRIEESEEFGSKDAEIVDVKLMSNNKELNIVKTNDPLDIDIYYKTKKEINNIVVGLAIKKNDKETIVYYTNTNFDNKKLTINKKGIISLHFDSFTLQRGTYYLGISLRDDKHTPLDIRKAYLRFDVESNVNSSGQFILEHSWDSK